MSLRSYELQMLDLFRVHFFGSRGAARNEPSEISPNQVFVLGELVRRNAPSLEELRSVLKVHLSTLSRAISHLNRVDMVRSNRDPHDARRIRAIPTSKGTAFARLSWVSQQAIIAHRLSGFLPVERTALESFLRVFVGDAAYEKIVPVPDEPEMAIISRALTYDHGVVSDNYLESGYPIMDWIALSEFHYEQRSPGELARLTRTPPSTISLRLKVLQQKGLLSVSQGLHDKRAREIRLSKKGIQELRHIEASAERYFSRTLRMLPPAQIEEGISLFRRYVLELRPEHSSSLNLERVSKKELNSLRRELIGRIAALGASYPIGPVLLNPSNQVVCITHNSKRIFILECEPQTSGKFRLINALPLLDQVTPASSKSVEEMLRNYLELPLTIPRELASYIDSRVG